MSKRSRVRKPTTYDYTLGAFGETPAGTPAGAFLASLLPRAIFIGALGIGVWHFFFSPKAAAKANVKDATVPTGGDTGANVTSDKGGTPAAFVDPGSKTAVLGPSETLMVSNDKHIVQKGESWANLAARAYGDYRWWPALWDANRKLGRFGTPSTLAVGDVIVVPKLPLESARFKKLVFDRAEVDRAWELKKLKKGAKAAGPRPKAVFTETVVFASDVAAVAAPKQPAQPQLPAQPQEPVKTVDYTTTGPANDGTEASAGYEDLSE